MQAEDDDITAIRDKRIAHTAEVMARMVSEVTTVYSCQYPVDMDTRNYVCNLDLLALFEGALELGLEQLAERAVELNFYSFRAGELIEWGFRHRILRRTGPARWSLLETELSWALFGRHQSYAVRVRGLTGQAAVEAGRLWKRELGRRRRADAKQMRKLLHCISRDMDMIVDMSPETKLSPELARFCAGSVDTVAGARQFVLGEVATISVREAQKIRNEIEAIYNSVDRLDHQRQLEQWAAGEEISDADQAALSVPFT